jgi:hypothetical protein
LGVALGGSQNKKKRQALNQVRGTKGRNKDNSFLDYFIAAGDSVGLVSVATWFPELAEFQLRPYAEPGAYSNFDNSDFNVDDDDDD